MKKRYCTLLGGVLLALLASGCQSAPDQNHTTANPSASEAAAVTIAPAAPYIGYHRYRGMVGRQPVTVVLTIGPDDSDSTKTVCSGAYYYGQATGGLLDLWVDGTYQPQQPLRLEESGPGANAKPTGQWRATQPAGPVLVGTWISPSGRQLPFALHEEYQDEQHRQMAVRYEVLKENATGPLCRPEDERDELIDSTDADSVEAEDSTQTETAQRNAAELYRDALHLLGPDTLRPALVQLQCPVPASRRTAAQAFVRGDGSCQETSEPIQVAFNDFGLLSLTAAGYVYSYGAPHFNHGATSTTYDLRTGEEVTFSALLKPRAEAQLQKLLTRHLRRDPHIEGEASVGKDTYGPDGLAGELVPLPDGFALSYTGLVCVYGEANISASLGYITLEVPYRELQPLLRPDSPVARMLRERGLWRVK